MSVTIIVPGKPMGKERPRFDGHHTYTPTRTRNYEERVQWEYRKAARAEHFIPRGVPVAVVIVIHSRPNASDTKKTKDLKLSHHLKPTKKPDCDNAAKAILDALNGVAYDDDSQVTALSVIKRYAMVDDVTVSISEDMP